MSFLRHGKSIDPMSGRENAGSRSSSLPPALIGLDEFQLAIPWRVVSTRARLRFTNRGQCAVNSLRWSSNFQRTAKSVLTGCLTPGASAESNRHLMKQWKNSLLLLFLVSVVAILALVTAILLIRRGFRATSQPSTFEKVLARNVRNFAIPTHERNRKSPLEVNSKTVMEAREHFVAIIPEND